MPNTWVTKPGNPHNGPHIIPPDDEEEAREYVSSASKDGDQLGPNIIPLDDPMYRYKTRSQIHQMNHVATLKNYSSKELMDTLREYWQEQEQKNYHVACVVTDEETGEELECCHLIKRE
eukprot:1457487-Ditylum_brightwellii.AAC.1